MLRPTKFFSRSVLRLIFLIDPRQLWRRYFIAISVILVLALGAELISFKVLSQTAQNSETINRMGYQRMLSQQILFLATENIGEPPEVLQAALLPALEEFDSNHKIVIERAIVTDEIEALYYSRDSADLHRSTLAFISLARALTTARVEDRGPAFELMVARGRGPLLDDLKSSVSLFQEAAEANVVHLESIRAIAMILAFIAVLAESMLIFIPGHVAIERTLDKMTRQKGLLARSNKQMETKNAELIEARDELQFAANHDSLTGLLNRRALSHEMDKLLTDEPSETGQGYVGVIQVDLDHFKPINDIHGHAAGDKVLRQVAKVLKSEVRRNDVVARVGGDEFVILITSCHEEEDIKRLSDRILKKLHSLEQLENGCHNVGASFGYVAGQIGADLPEHLLSRADTALYMAKRSGRNRIHLHQAGEEMH